jgi:allantoicase/malate synthase/CubicO group peptidase (beta-lactamase class C family)/2-oxo-4-hydroxy-4-carboxy--5-ureidoimidazoline (OHCU) decarboxylase
MNKREIPYYEDYVSTEFQNYLKDEGVPFEGVPGLMQIGESGGLENKGSLKFLCDLYDKVKLDLNKVLVQRKVDREFIDQRVGTYHKLNEEHDIDFLSSEYRMLLGDEDSEGRIVIGPKLKNYCGKSDGDKIAPLPEYLKGFHVTLFGPPDDAKLSINAMNAYHRKLKEEPAIVSEILQTNNDFPKWGADDEDSKTPLRSDLISAGVNLTGCLNLDISFKDEKRNKEYKLAEEKLSYPIKRFPGLALPTSFLFYHDNPLPLHLYDFATHLFENYKNPKALTFYVPKLENEEEAAYIKIMIETAEKMIQSEHAEYKLGTVRVIIVLENPRAVFRVNEMMDELYPYFAGASLGWHDYLGSTARLFKNDSNYRIPVKADPDIVIKYIKASHNLLADVVGQRGGIKIGGMYGILPIDNDLFSDSFQVTIRGFFRDVLTQMKRDLSGYWVAHPDFIRIGMAIVEAWKFYAKGDETKLKGLIDGLLNDHYAKEIWEFVKACDIDGLSIDDELYARSLIVADIKESSFIANNHPDEIRYNVFQMLQYLTDWLSGNGCVALPTQINGVPARVMDDLATAERSRWEVWHEIEHGRFSVEDFIRIAHEEMNFIRRDLSNDKKIVQVKYSDTNSKWYEVALQLMIKLMTDKVPVEFATELLIPFTIDSIRIAEKPWEQLLEIDPKKYQIEPYVLNYNYYFEMCGADKFAKDNCSNITGDIKLVDDSVMSFSKVDVLSAASFHGDIGQAAKSLDSMAKLEQEKVSTGDDQAKSDLIKLGEEYLSKFGMKFLVSAKGKSCDELLEILNSRIGNTEEEELLNAKRALLEITKKRMDSHPITGLKKKLDLIFDVSNVVGAQLAVSSGRGQIHTVALGQTRIDGNNVTADTLFEIASLSKTFGTAFSHEFFQDKGISLDTCVNKILEKYNSDFRLKSKSNENWENQVTLKHLMGHGALNMHYVNGVPSGDEMPNINKFLSGNVKYSYEAIEIQNEPGTKFQYSGAGFIILEYIIELISGESSKSIGQDFFDNLALGHLSFDQRPSSENYAFGYNDNKEVVEFNYKMFPTFAAGMWASGKDVLVLLENITTAFDEISGTQAISHDTAVNMTYGTDKGCKEFMNALMGQGVFTVEAGENEFLLHQGANDGYRAIYLYCYKGPDKYKGLSLHSNSELNGVVLNSLLTQEVLKELRISGIDFSRFIEDFSIKSVPTEEVVNIGYKKLIIDAFQATLPEPITRPLDLLPLNKWNVALDAKISKISNQRFAGAENLISKYEPYFDPAEFGAQGKIMDSWETARHNLGEYDSLILNLKEKSDINYISISTKYHDGNQVEWVELMADGEILLEKTQLSGHAFRNIKLNKTFINAQSIEVRVYPDGGITRLGLYTELPEDEASQFSLNSEARNIRFKELIPHSAKPLGINPESFIFSNKVERKNYASLAFGAKVLSATDEHYAPAVNVLSPFEPLNMFDGLESKRSRVEGHKEEVVIELSEEIVIGAIEFDFKYFVNNSPSKLSIDAKVNDEWKSVVTNHPCKAYAANKLVIKPVDSLKSRVLRIAFLPDGGVNRIKVYEKN